MKAYIQTGAAQRPLSALILFLLTVVTQIGLAQRTPLTLGELGVEVKNSSTALSITANASGNVGGTRCDYYVITHNYDSRSTSTSGSWWLQHLDRNGCPPGTGSSYFAYGAYTITIQNHSAIMDYRDADYEDGGGSNNFGTGYTTADLKIYYNAADGVFYKNDSLTRPVSGGYCSVSDH